MRFACAASLVVVAALSGCEPAAAPVVTSRLRPGPKVDSACIDGATRGVLVSGLPSAIGRYRVVEESATTIYLKRTGRALTESEGTKAFASFRPMGMAMGSSAISSIYRCPDTPREACLVYDLWLCQTSLERLASELDEAFARAGAADGEVGLRVTVLEASGPPCKETDVCAPTPHYSRKGKYNPPGRRQSHGDGIGHCDADRDCVGGGNICQSWYLRGGSENAIYIQYARPAFCGCIDNACTWFEQPRD